MDVRNVFLPMLKVDRNWFRYSKGTGTVWRVCGCHAPDILCSGTGGGNRRRSGTKEPDCTAAGKAGIRRVASPLKNAGLKVEDVPLYETVCKLQETLKETIEKQQRQGEIDLVTFTSASTVRGFVQALPGIDTTKIRAVCIGEQTANEAKRYGMQIQISEEASVESMVLKILELAED